MIAAPLNAADPAPKASPDPALANGAAGAAQDPVAPAEVPVDPPANQVAAQLVTSVAGRTVGFDGTSGLDAADRSYSWDFGDGSSGTGSTVSHTYSADGTYAVTVTVSGGDDSAKPVTQSVTVTAPAVENPN